MRKRLVPAPLLAAVSPAVIPMARILKQEKPSQYLGFGEEPINKTEDSLNSAPPELTDPAAPTKSVPLEANSESERRPLTIGELQSRAAALEQSLAEQRDITARLES